MNIIDLQSTAKNIKRLRIERNVSAQQLADMMGIAVQAVYKWERGVNLPSVDNMFFLADIYHVNVDDIIVRKQYNMTFSPYVI